MEVTNTGDGVLLVQRLREGPLSSVHFRFGDGSMTLCMAQLPDTDFMRLASVSVDVRFVLGEAGWGKHRAPDAFNRDLGLVNYLMKIDPDMYEMLGTVPTAKVIIHDYPPIEFDLVPAWPILIGAMVEASKLVTQ